MALLWGFDGSDDNIQFLTPGTLNEINGAGKRQLLAWPAQEVTIVWPSSDSVGHAIRSYE